MPYTTHLLPCLCLTLRDHLLLLALQTFLIRAVWVTHRKILERRHPHWEQGWAPKLGLGWSMKNCEEKAKCFSCVVLSTLCSTYWPSTPKMEFLCSYMLPYTGNPLLSATGPDPSVNTHWRSPKYYERLALLSSEIFHYIQIELLTRVLFQVELRESSFR